MGIINMGTANFKTFDETGKELLNANLATYCFVKSGKLTRLISHTFESTYRVIGKKARTANTGHKNIYGYIHTPHYCVYYIDLPLDSISPIPFIYYTGSATDADTVPSLVYLSTGKVGNNTRLFFYSNGRLSDTELNSFNIYIFDIKPLKEDKVGLNLYNQQGQLTFSSKTYPLSIMKIVRTTDITENQYITINGVVSLGVYCEPVKIFHTYDYEGYRNTDNLYSTTFLYIVNNANTTLVTKKGMEYSEINLDGRKKGWYRESRSIDSNLTASSAFYRKHGVGYDGTVPAGYYMQWRDTYEPTKKEILDPKDGELKAIVIDVTHLPFPFN